MSTKAQMSIFIVEDNPMYSLYIDTLLKENFNFKISTFESGEKCLDDLYIGPDIIILDYLLGETNGLEVLSSIRRKLPDTPVILLTGQQDINTAISLMKAGAYEYIIKDKNAPRKLTDAIIRIEQAKRKKMKRFILF